MKRRESRRKRRRKRKNRLEKRKKNRKGEDPANKQAFIELITSQILMEVLSFHLKILPKIVSKYFYRGQRDGSAL